jgi:hypothetical protein
MIFPILHEPFELGTKVVCSLDEFANKTETGEVAGVVSTSSLIWYYIVILDQPFTSHFGLIKAISIPGTKIKRY